MAKFVVDNNEIEVPDEAVLASGFIPKAEANKHGFVPQQYMQSEITRRLNSAKEGTVKLEDLATNDELRQQVIDKLGIDPNKIPKETLNAEVDRHRATWEREALAPVKTRLDKLQQANERLLRSSLHAKILGAANEVGLDESLLKGAAGVPPMAIAMFERMAKYDEETGEFFAVDATGNYMPTSNPTGNGLPYKTVPELLKAWAADPINKAYVKSQAQAGPGVQPQKTVGSATVTPGGGVPATVSRGDMQAMSRYAKEIASGQTKVV